jgi:putative redox protein
MSEHDRPRTGRAESGRATARIGVAPFRTEIELPEGHHLTVDAPAFAGGANAGPSPMDLLAAALAASCTTMLRKEADRLGWPMDAAQVSVSHRRTSARELGEARRGTIDFFACDVRIDGVKLTPQQRRRLLDASAHGWVEHAVRHGSRVETRLTE